MSSQIDDLNVNENDDIDEEAEEEDEEEEEAGEEDEEDEDDPFSMAVKELSETNRQADEIARVSIFSFLFLS